MHSTVVHYYKKDRYYKVIERFSSNDRQYNVQTKVDKYTQESP